MDIREIFNEEEIEEVELIKNKARGNRRRKTFKKVHNRHKFIKNKGITYIWCRDKFYDNGKIHGNLTYDMMKPAGYYKKMSRVSRDGEKSPDNSRYGHSTKNKIAECENKLNDYYNEIAV